MPSEGRGTDLLTRLRERHLVRWTLAYLAAAFALLQGVDIVAQRFGWPGWIERVLIVAAGVGFFVVLVLAWYHGERGAQRVSRRELGTLALLLGLGGVALWRFGPAAPGASRAAAVESPPPGGIPARSIAVLPFAEMGGTSTNSDFSDGITEEILNALAQIPGIKVAARTSAFAFKGKSVDLRDIGETLGVATVLEGAVQTAGDQVRIHAQLVDARTGYRIWSEQYDRKLTSVFAVEDEIARAIADRLRAQWSEGQPLVRVGTRDVQAHSLYLQGIAAIAQRGPALQRAAKVLREATERDPAYAAAWAQLSQAQELLPWYGLAPWDSSLDEAERSARQAIALDSSSADARAALANVLRDRFAFVDAEREYRRALELNPGASETHNQYGQMLDAVARFDEAIAQENIAATLDPLAPNPRYILGILLESTRRHAEAVAAYDGVIRLAPGFVYSYGQLAYSLMYTGDYARARSVAADPRGQVDVQLTTAMIDAVADSARRPAALRLCASASRIGRVDMGALASAFCYGSLGARERAIERLQTWAAGAPQGELFNGVRFLWMPAFDAVREDPRFQALLTRLGLPQWRP